MKNIFLILSIMLTGCATQFQLFQVLEEGALAYECTNWDTRHECIMDGQLVFVLNQEGIEYYDGKIVKAPYGKRAVKDGVYRYISNDNRSRTVPIIRFE